MAMIIAPVIVDCTSRSASVSAKGSGANALDSKSRCCENNLKYATPYRMVEFLYKYR